MASHHDPANPASYKPLIYPVMHNDPYGRGIVPIMSHLVESRRLQTKVVRLASDANPSCPAMHSGGTSSSSASHHHHPPFLLEQETHPALAPASLFCPFTSATASSLSAMVNAFARLLLLPALPAGGLLATYLSLRRGFVVSKSESLCSSCASVAISVSVSSASKFSIISGFAVVNDNSFLQVFRHDVFFRYVVDLLDPV